MRIEIRCVSYSEDTSEAIKQMDAVYGPTFVRLFGDGVVSQSFADLVISTSIMHPAAPRIPDSRRGSYHKQADTYFSSCRLDYADWIPQDWRSRVLGYGEAVNTAIMRIAKTRLTGAERLALLDVNARTITEVMALAPEFIAPLKPISLIYFDRSDRAGIHFGPVPGADDFSPPGVRYVEVRPEDAFSIPASQTKGEETLPLISRQYRRDEDGLHFYEAFPHEGRIAEYEGLCGVGGENRFYGFETPVQAAKIIARLKMQMKAKGFRSIAMSKHKRLIVEYPVEGDFANTDELDRRHALEDFLNDWTGRLGLGHCDGGSSGQGTMEVCCLVVDFNMAKAALESILADSKFRSYRRIYREI